jgi:hypothetical protein
VLGGIVVKLQQGVEVIDDLDDRLRKLGPEVDLEGPDRRLSLVDVLDRRQSGRMC